MMRNEEMRGEVGRRGDVGRVNWKEKKLRKKRGGGSSVGGRETSTGRERRAEGRSEKREG